MASQHPTDGRSRLGDDKGKVDAIHAYVLLAPTQTETDGVRG
jgi:hypothetical protein